jgi:hypothetical protein
MALPNFVKFINNSINVLTDSSDYIGTYFFTIKMTDNQNSFLTSSIQLTLAVQREPTRTVNLGPPHFIFSDEDSK